MCDVGVCAGVWLWVSARCVGACVRVPKTPGGVFSFSFFVFFGLFRFLVFSF